MKTSNQQQRISLLINIIIPMLILTKLSGEAYLGTTRGLVVALAFPLGYALREYYQTKKRSFVAGLGVFSVLMTGGIGLLELPIERVAIKEAGVPAIIGCILLGSYLMKKNLVEKMFLHVLDKEKIFAHLAKNKMHVREDGVKKLTFRVIGAFALSAILNYFLAAYIVTSPAGTEAFNEEIGKMTGLSFPVIALPVTIILTVALVTFLYRLQKTTGIDMEDMIKKDI